LPSEPGAPFGHKRTACGSEPASVPHKTTATKTPCKMRVKTMRLKKMRLSKMRFIVGMMVGRFD
jgi:hypothetical protein